MNMPRVPIFSALGLSEHTLLIRRLTIQLKASFDKHWNDGNVLRTAIANAFSMIFPPLEKLAVRQRSGKTLRR